MQVRSLREPIILDRTCSSVSISKALVASSSRRIGASDSVLIPLQCEYYALEGLSQLINTVRLMRRGLNPGLDIEGILFTMFDSRTNLANAVVNEVKAHFADKIYRTVIPRNIRLSEAPSHGKPVIWYDKYSRGAESYRALATEFAERRR